MSQVLNLNVIYLISLGVGYNIFNNLVWFETNFVAALSN